MMTFTPIGVAAELAREVALRQNVYKKKVEAGTMEQREANRKIAIMQQALDEQREKVRERELEAKVAERVKNQTIISGG